MLKVHVDMLLVYIVAFVHHLECILVLFLSAVLSRTVWRLVWRHMNPEQPVQRDRLCLNILNNQLFLVLCFDVLMFCLFVLFFILVLFIYSIFSHLHIIMYDREIIFIFCYFVDVNFHHNV